MILKTLSSLGLLDEGFAGVGAPLPVRPRDSEALPKELLLKERDFFFDKK